MAELQTFRRAAAQAGMSDFEIEALIRFIAANPEGEDEIEGTGGCRKVRVSGRGKGKSGGYRVITFFSGRLMPVFLLTVFGKDEKATLTKKECNTLRVRTKAIVDESARTIGELE